MERIYYSAKRDGFFVSSIHEGLPSDAVEISFAAYQGLLAGQAEGKQIVADENGEPILIEPPAEKEETLTQLKNRLISQVSNLADKLQQNHIPATVTAAVVAQNKADEAMDFSGKLAMNKNFAPSYAEYPLLAASVRVEGESLTDVAELFLLNYTFNQNSIAKIEAARLKAYASITNAVDKNAAEQAVSQLIATVETDGGGS